MKKANLANFGDDNTIYAAFKDITSLIYYKFKDTLQPVKILQVSNWFETNHMFAYPDKFQAIAVHHNKNINEN